MTAAPLPLFNLQDPSSVHGLGGLLACSGGVERAMPLREVKVRATLVGDCARVEVEQRFANPLTQPMEVVHLFPVPLEAAVVELELRCGDLVVRGDLVERQEGERRFEQARQAGHRAGLLTRERDDVHTLRVTSLPPGEEVRVHLVLVQRLERVDGRFEWRFPTTLAPRYTPGTPVGHEGPGVHPDTDRVPDASRVQPPLLLAGGARLDLEVEIQGQVTALESSLHALRLDLGGGGVRVAPAAEATLNKDFALRYSGAAEQLGARAFTDGRYSLVVVEGPTGFGAPALPRDVVFVIDISGSMHGAKLLAAQRALIAALHALMPGDRFQLLAFDDRLERFAADFTPYDDSSLARADRWVAALRARGGTEMAPALTAALAGGTPAGRLRTVLFITDGQSTDEQGLLTLVSTRLNGARLFTLGIDSAVNTSLMRQLARAGGGTCELAAPGDNIEGVVARLEARFGSPVLTEVQLPGLNTAWPLPQVVFSGRAATLLAEHGEQELVVQGQHAQGLWTARLTPQRVNVPLGVLWARERVQMLEDRLRMRPFEEHVILPELRRVALEHRILSRCTAFVAVEQSLSVPGTRREVVQGHLLPEGWDPGFAGTSAGAFPPSPGGPMPAMAPPPSPPPMAAPSGMRRERTPAGPPLGAMPPQASLADAEVYADEQIDAMAPAPKRRKEASASGDMLSRVGGMLRGRAAPAKAEEARREQAPAEASADARLAVLQGADGSFGGDVARTAAALLALLVLGHTRRQGARQRTVLKAAQWLEGRRGDPAAALALDALARAERGESPLQVPGWEALAPASAEAAVLREVMGG